VANGDDSVFRQTTARQVTPPRSNTPTSVSQTQRRAPIGRKIVSATRVGDEEEDGVRRAKFKAAARSKCARVDAAFRGWEGARPRACTANTKNWRIEPARLHMNWVRSA
jgi:hypothetical protein